MWDSYVKAIRDLQVDQEQFGRPATKAIRENPTVAQMADNLQRAAERNGATHGYVQVEESNAAALRLYDGLGFGEHHRYRYAEPNPSSS